MYINRPILLLLLISFIFSPAIFDWMLAADGAWYRPYFFWFALVVIAYWLQPRRGANEP